MAIIGIIISVVALLLNIIAVRAQSKTIKYQKASIESLERIIDMQGRIIETQKEHIDFFERELLDEIFIKPDDLPKDVIKEIQDHAFGYVATHDEKTEQYDEEEPYGNL